MLRLLHRLRAPLAACALAPLALTACGAPAAPSATAESPTTQATTAFSPSPGAHGSRDGAGGHGHIEGAEELDEAATSLAVLSATGELSLIGLEDLSVTPVTRVEGATTAATDRRLLALGGAGGRVSLADSGVWTQDHGDHQHYYRAPATALGPLAAPAAAGGRETVEAESAPPTIASSAQYTAVTASGRMTLLDRRALEQGQVSPVMTAEVDPGSYAAPLGSHVVAVRQGQALLLDEQGTAVGDSLPCPRATGGIATRAGVVLGCEGGAVVVSLPDPQAQTPVLEWVALPETAPQGTSLVSFGARPGRPKVAALDSHGGWWSLSIRERSWSGPQADPADTNGPGAGPHWWLSAPWATPMTAWWASMTRAASTCGPMEPRRPSPIRSPPPIWWRAAASMPPPTAPIFPPPQARRSWRSTRGPRRGSSARSPPPGS